MPYASVYPLVTARAVARPFTYEVPEEVGVGAIVRVPFGRSRARGIVLSDTVATDTRARRATSRMVDTTRVHRCGVAHFAYVAAWEYAGEGKPPVLNKEPLVYENIKLSQRSYK